MKRTFFTVALFTVFFAVSAYAVNTTRYWDGCKPSCGWTANASGSPNGVCKSCNVSGSVLSDDGARNACEGGGTAYTCMKQAPWKVSDNMSYGFAASHTNGDCGKCFELTFTNTSISGKKMTIMVSNIGGDVGQNQFDLMIPGGGVGQYNALSTQVSQNGGSSSNLGQQYGGFRATCGNNKDCVRKMCNDAFGSAALADMKAGCDWYVDWFDIADNPQANSASVTCPAELIAKYKGQFTSNPTPTPTTYTLTVNRNPAAGGSTTPASSQSNITGGQQVNISATASAGYTFTNWTISGSGTLANANSASTSVTVSGNVTVTANFTQQTPTTYTLTVNHTPTDGGSTNPASSQTNISAGQQVNISATAANNYTFTNWTISGSGTLANANNASTSVTVNGNATVTANFRQNAAQYTLTVNRDPANTGTVTVNNANYTAPVTVNGGASVPISATAPSGYVFSSWAVTSGTAQINNANSASTSITINSNATITAKFSEVSVSVPYKLTINRSPGDAGTVAINGNVGRDTITVNGGTQINIVATAASGYSFTSWTVASGGGASIANANDRTTTVTLSSNATITANFISTVVTPPSGGGRDTIKVEAEDYTGKVGDNIQIGSNDAGVVCIGYIENGYSTTYNNVTAQQAGDYVMYFSVATGVDQSSFTVTVNGTNVGTISTGNTGGWDTYVTLSLRSSVRLNAGSNTVTLNFGGAINVDYFLLVGDKVTVVEPPIVTVPVDPVDPTDPTDPTDPIAVKYKAAAKAHAHIALRPTVRGFTAALPAGHGFSSYSVIDIQGRQIRTGKLGASTADISVSNLKRSVVFLRLEGKGKTPVSMKVVTY
jgi:uncharacterized repeat protein (TIGR02543 family)